VSNNKLLQILLFLLCYTTKKEKTTTLSEMLSMDTNFASKRSQALRKSAEKARAKAERLKGDLAIAEKTAQDIQRRLVASESALKRKKTAIVQRLAGIFLLYLMHQNPKTNFTGFLSGCNYFNDENKKILWQELLSKASDVKWSDTGINVFNRNIKGETKR